MKLKQKVYLIWLCILIWLGVTSFIYAVRNPKLTYTELFLHLPKTITLQWYI